MSTHFHSLVFTEPFGTLVHDAYDQLAAWEVTHHGPHPASAVPPGDGFLYTSGPFSRRGALWFDGSRWGSHFATGVPTKEFFPNKRSHFQRVSPFLLMGYANETPHGLQFIACDLPLWRGRLLSNVPFQRRDRLLRFTLSQLVANQPLKFLRERRLDLPVFHQLPGKKPLRQQCLSGNSDYYVVDSRGSAWRNWCLDWVE